MNIMIIIIKQGVKHMDTAKKSGDILQLVSECWQSEMQAASRALDVLERLVLAFRKRAESSSEVCQIIAEAEALLSPVHQQRPDDALVFAQNLRNFMAILQAQVADAHNPFELAQSETHIYRRLLQSAETLLTSIEGGGHGIRDLYRR